MPIDPRIATSLQPTDIAGAIAGGMQWHDQRQAKSRLADLLPQAAHGDQAAIDDLWAIDPRIAEHMDDRQRQEAAAKTDDLTAAVRWADTPEKWQQVQQRYGSEGVDLSPYRFEDRERGLMVLGKLSGYLKDPPKAEYRTLEPGGSLIDVSGGQPRVVIAPNDGSYQTGAPAQQAGDFPRVSNDADYNALKPGQRFITPDGQVRVKRGGQTASPSGPFPSSGY